MTRCQSELSPWWLRGATPDGGARREDRAERERETDCYGAAAVSRSAVLGLYRTKLSWARRETEGGVADGNATMPEWKVVHVLF